MSKWGIRDRNDIELGLRIDPSYYLNEFFNAQMIAETNNATMLSEFIKISSSNIDPKKVYGKNIFSYIDISIVDNNTGIIHAKRLLGEKAPSRARRVVQKDDVLISSVRPDRSTVALITERHDGHVCSTGFFICRPNKNKIKPAFLFILLKSSNIINQLVRKTTATMYPTINKEDILNLIVKIPNLEEQEKISRNVINVLDNIYKSEEKIGECLNKIECIQYLNTNNKKNVSQTTFHL